MEKIAYLSLGSNIGDSLAMLQKAVHEIGALPDCKLVKTSSIYYTEPQDFRQQPWFANSVIKLSLAPSWQPQSFLQTILGLETALGRVRIQGMHKGPRTIDIDLLLFDDCKLSSAICTVPHPRLTERAFVLAPLREIEPAIIINGESVNHWLDLLVWRQEGFRIFQ